MSGTDSSAAGAAPLGPKQSTPAASHTAGPWVARRTRKGYALKFSAPGWTSFARVFVRMEGSDSDLPEGVANAAVMLAAPDLLAALIALANAADDVGVKFFDTDDMDRFVEAMQAATLNARAIIAKATQPVASRGEANTNPKATS